MQFLVCDHIDNGWNWITKKLMGIMWKAWLSWWFEMSRHVNPSAATIHQCTFQSYLLNKEIQEREKIYLCLVLQSRVFQDGGTKACVLHPQTKHMVCLVFMHSSCSAIRLCNDVSYHVSYHGTCIEICIVLWEIIIILTVHDTSKRCC